MTPLEAQAIQPMMDQIEQLRKESMRKVWCTYDNPETGEVAGVVCPDHAHLLKDDPTLAPLKEPDPTRPCLVCKPEFND